MNYYTGQLFDLRAHRRARRGGTGCVVGLRPGPRRRATSRCALHDWDVDFAVWCSYKYLNGGPGRGRPAASSTSGTRDRRRPAALRRLVGQRPASALPHAPRAEFAPAPGADGWQLSNPPILALAPLRASLALFDEAGMQALRAKSIALTGYLERLDRSRRGRARSRCSPRATRRRGAASSRCASRERPRELFAALAARPASSATSASRTSSASPRCRCTTRSTTSGASGRRSQRWAGVGRPTMSRTSERDGTELLATTSKLDELLALQQPRSRRRRSTTSCCSSSSTRSTSCGSSSCCTSWTRSSCDFSRGTTCSAAIDTLEARADDPQDAGRPARHPGDDDADVVLRLPRSAGDGVGLPVDAVPRARVRARATSGPAMLEYISRSGPARERVRAPAATSRSLVDHFYDFLERRGVDDPGRAASAEPPARADAADRACSAACCASTARSPTMAILFELMTRRRRGAAGVALPPRQARRAHDRQQAAAPAAASASSSSSGRCSSRSSPTCGPSGTRCERAWSSTTSPRRLAPALAVWPGDTPPRARSCSTWRAGDNLTLSTLHATVHLGAHADAPSHYGADAPTIEQRPLELLPRAVPSGARRRRAAGAARRRRTCPGSRGAERVLFATGTLPRPRALQRGFRRALARRWSRRSHAAGRAAGRHRHAQRRSVRLEGAAGPPGLPAPRHGDPRGSGAATTCRRESTS